MARELSSNARYLLYLLLAAFVAYVLFGMASGASLQTDLSALVLLLIILAAAFVIKKSFSNTDNYLDGVSNVWKSFATRHGLELTEEEAVTGLPAVEGTCAGRQAKLSVWAEYPGFTFGRHRQPHYYLILKIQAKTSLSFKISGVGLELGRQLERDRKILGPLAENLQLARASDENELEGICNALPKATTDFLRSGSINSIELADGMLVLKFGYGMNSMFSTPSDVDSKLEGILSAGSTLAETIERFR